MAEPDTINPPKQHASEQWHWARHETDDKWFIFEAKDGRMWNGPNHMSAECAYQYGWRYSGPAIPPTAIPKAKAVLTKAEQIADMSNEDWERFLRRRGSQGRQPMPDRIG